MLEQATPSLLNARDQLIDKTLNRLATFKQQNYTFEAKAGLDSVWVLARWPKGGGCAFRVAYTGAKLKVKQQTRTDRTLNLDLEGALGSFKVTIELLDGSQPFLHWTTSINSSQPLIFSCVPRDVYPIDENGDPCGTQGKIYSKQEGPKAGILYFTIETPQTGVILYMQNFSNLNDYFSKTHSAPNSVVGGKWPELGYSPPNDNKTTLPKNSETVVSEAYVLLSSSVPKDQFEAAEQYLEMQRTLYFVMKKKETAYHDYLTKAQKAIKDLATPKCSVEIDGQRYLRAYVEADNSPPESMVQLAVLMPLVEYENWREEPIEFSQTLRKSLKKFYDKKLQTIIRYLPGCEFDDGANEPQQDPSVMDSWYLFHPLLNLARLAIRGYKDAEKMFFAALGFAIKGARHFNYKWPVLYDMQSFEVKMLKPNGEGEQDVACIYALVMMHAYELSNDKRYLEEAEKAAKSLDNLGFNLPYQLNVTAFGISAFWRLYQTTKKECYKKLVWLCIANIFSNSWMWECEYGYATNYYTFMGIPPLAEMKENSYLASYEELEVLSAFDDLFLNAKDEELLPSVRLLLAEYTKYVLDRCWSYFPANLPKEVLAEKPKSGKIDRNLAIPIEDLREGWMQSGQVGQEVYGAGGVLVTITRHFNHKKDWPFTVFCEYPTKDYNFQKDKKQLQFHVCGDPNFTGKLRILQFKKRRLPKTRVFQVINQELKELKGKPTKEKVLEYNVSGGTDVLIDWGRGEKDE